MTDSVFRDGSYPQGQWLLTPEERRTIRLMNEERERVGVPALLTIDAGAIQTLATWKATDQLLNPTVKSHTDSLGRTFQDRVLIGYNVNPTAGEILAWYYDTPDAVIAGWMGSPGHKAAIINPAYKYVGLCLRRDAGGLEYWAAVFGDKPLLNPSDQTG